MVESPPADAGDTGSCPGLGRSHMPQSGWAREPWPLSLRVRSLCSAAGEATAVRGPRTAKKKKVLGEQILSSLLQVPPGVGGWCKLCPYLVSVEGATKEVCFISKGYILGFFNWRTNNSIFQSCNYLFNFFPTFERVPIQSTHFTLERISFCIGALLSLLTLKKEFKLFMSFCEIID